METTPAHKTIYHGDHIMSNKSEYYQNKQKKYEEIFFERVVSVHKKRYILDKTVYAGMKENVTVTCRIHGDFTIKAHSLSKGCNCPACASLGQSRKLKNDPNRTKWLNRNSSKQRKTIEIFIDQSMQIHGNKYDYSNVEYKNNISKVEIGCPVHGSFFQKPSYHVHGKNGCPKCGNNYSVKENMWLDSFGIPLKKQHRIYYNKRKYYQVDGFHEETNTVYEFLGDYWHGNLNVYASETVNGRTKETMQVLHTNTMVRLAHLRQLGYCVIHIWESDYVPIALPNK